MNKIIIHMWDLCFIYLSQGAVQLPQEIVIHKCLSFIVKIIHYKLQLLDFFKSINL